MLFHEVYGSYYRTVAAILTEAAGRPLSPADLTAMVQKQAFGESALAIPAALRDGQWPLLDKEGHSVLAHAPAAPLTTLEKRWLKSLLSDPRIALFAPDDTGLGDVEPLFSPGDFVYFDRYGDGDPYGDSAYIVNFRTALAAIREKRLLRVRFHSRAGLRRSLEVIPFRLEYSPRDDRFRLQAARGDRLHTINISRVYSCELLEAPVPEGFSPPRRQMETLTLLLHDRRNGLERALLHFSPLEKETKKLADGLYEITLRYDQEDETDLLIRVLSFGPVVEVTGPERFRSLVRERLRRQMALNGKR